jgi:hypothetical protein
MAQILIALALVGALVWFVLSRTSTTTEGGSPQPYGAETQKARDVQDSMQQIPQMRQDQLDQQLPLEPREADPAE